MIECLNGRTAGWLKGEYVGRSIARHFIPALKNGSVLGNPFKPESATPISHQLVCNEYRRWLWSHINGSSTESLAIRAELQRIKRMAVEGDLKLLCWCDPLPCHAHVLRDCLMWAISNDFDFISESN
jgi:hypothetical protein